MFSRRTGWDLAANAVGSALEAARASGRALLDLTESNPTRCGLEWDQGELGRALLDPRIASYEPAPLGLQGAREAVAAYLSRGGRPVDPRRIVLTASTSEAYALVLKLLCDPGDEVLFPAPCYPLLEVLAGLESASLARYPVAWDADWDLDQACLRDAVGPRTRALVAVNPSVPTGACARAGDLELLERFCADRGLALLLDEVHAETGDGVVALAGRSALTFRLSGLSKVAGLPQLKVAWIALAGPEDLAAEAASRLEVAADCFLSPSGPSQLALPRLLDLRERFLVPLRERLAANRRALARAVPGSAPFGAIAGPAGWTAVLRVGETQDEERLCLGLLESGVAVWPGFFYDFPRNGHLVVSLLVKPEVMEGALAVLVPRLVELSRPNG
ncbi:MAG TPA: pyridoxal phosphate-dependent aminotransferase [Anaeromyxobacteraceae bacterium]|nr:pyridoxal phosphate-dependent aminotransferase [Anaeromyxobacteraceae bacterium]